MLKNKDFWRLQYHLMPPDGWLNDPNGLCQLDGIYNIYFQYSPNTPGPDGRKARTWGQYRGSSLLDLQFTGVPFWPVDPEDRDGCYSGSALVEDHKFRLYYTGNVKQAGEHDFTYSGREANEILVETDGVNYGEKQVVLRNSDYPESCTCHVRDPKVWKDGDVYYMVLGARTSTGADTIDTDFGEALFYRSEDGVKWTLVHRLTSDERFGYMWECPDYFEIDGMTVLSICPQGVESEEYRYQNIYQSGYYRVSGPFGAEQKLQDFREWDYGFDFYAPQTFVDERGRRLLIGWVGMPDAPYRNATADQTPYWENCLTVPRVLTVEDGIVLQNPIEELEELRYDETPVRPRDTMILEQGAGDFEISFLEGTEDDDWDIRFGEDTTLSYRNGVLTLNAGEHSGCGRTVRRVEIPEIEFMRILVDSSILEIYVNDGAYVLTTRFYPDYSGEKQNLEVVFNCRLAAITGWQMYTTATNKPFV